MQYTSATACELARSSLVFPNIYLALSVSVRTVQESV